MPLGGRNARDLRGEVREARVQRARVLHSSAVRPHETPQLVGIHHGLDVRVVLYHFGERLRSVLVSEVLQLSGSDTALNSLESHDNLRKSCRTWRNRES